MMEKEYKNNILILLWAPYHCIEWNEPKKRKIVRAKHKKSILKVGRRILFLATIHAKPLRVITNLWNHISITHRKTCWKKKNTHTLAHSLRRVRVGETYARDRPRSCENKCTWWVAVGFFKIYAARNFPSFRFIFIFWHRARFFLFACTFYLVFLAPSKESEMCFGWFSKGLVLTIATFASHFFGTFCIQSAFMGLIRLSCLAYMVWFGLAFAIIFFSLSFPESFFLLLLLHRHSGHTFPSYL